MALVSDMAFTRVGPNNAAEVYAVYHQSPTYFGLIGMDPPELADVERELSALAADTRRRALLLYLDKQPVAYLDYKLDYPLPHEAAISLLLVAESRQRKGIGTQVVAQLEQQLTGKTGRLYAVVYGHNPPASRFWKSLGYHYLKDGGPALAWFVKSLQVTD